ncbi:Hypothetical protein MIP_04642 [Mycobacterium intracellulare subsp. intracellulare MTCC 9506]|uniref:Uncharacterized protein n=1 Tax=Mycobacterium indicus pranii (strain DSM 45239 / MTCC 9506) TaxID=1232724 RepID=J9WG41_MYCIP|nr:Hypothetical protein MIP_04642 [Mycobacterium intracellulare subsp. intracellulare MTCC 9506]
MNPVEGQADWDRDRGADRFRRRFLTASRLGDRTGCVRRDVNDQLAGFGPGSV